ncbi:LacI family DNA-binding transcriptional regulator [Microbacterium flavum]|uniref:LacI family DNA-binding transcriptional regulator n=1 Tax=Microbacterium flavum TaxID=415216 RepID=A0ABS5XXU7_9MICO|nr:LacI family DNA-binding transcriptional regulator [Microbacterium flavum]MBT8799369.1 LacI family DNA-binding transcriptional regulator [Microbacterium flavum]
MSALDDVARAAGVSTATVSRALSGRGRTSEATRARVREVAERLGYVASATAAGLASGRAENIGVIVPLMDRWFFATVLDGIASRLAPRGYDVTLYNVTDDPAQRRRLFETALRRRRVDAVIVLSVALTDDEVAALGSLGLPVRGLGVPRGELGGPRVDDTAVGRAATQHLRSLGHRDIAHIGQSVAGGGPADPAFDIPSRRRAGFEAEMAASGLTGRFVAGDFTVAGGARAARELLTGPHPPTAIFAGSDEMAYGALTAARERGIRVPADLSIIGVDGHDLADLFDLTTIDQFPHAQGERVADAILAAVTGEAGPAAGGGVPRSAAASGPLPFSLVTRGTTAPPPG